MQRIRPWTLVETETLQDCRVFSVGRTSSRSPSTGETHAFYTIDSADWVNVVPLTPADEVVMVRQYRHGSREITLEIPGGLIDPGESPAAAAVRELLEETGYRAREVAAIGAVNPNPALFGNTVHTFIARDAERVDEVRNEGTEETAVELIPAGEIEARMRAGEIDHALVIAGLTWWRMATG